MGVVWACAYSFRPLDTFTWSLTPSLVPVTGHWFHVSFEALQFQSFFFFLTTNSQWFSNHQIEIDNIYTLIFSLGNDQMVNDLYRMDGVTSTRWVSVRTGTDVRLESHVNGLFLLVTGVWGLPELTDLTVQRTVTIALLCWRLPQWYWP